MQIVKAQAERFVDLAASVVNTPNRADLAAMLMTYPIDLESWRGAGCEILLEKGELVGRALTEVGRFAPARSWFERAVAAKEKGDVQGRVDHDSLGRSLHQVGDCLASTGEFAAARPWFERAVTEAEKGDVHGRVDHKSLAQTLRTGARCLRVLGLVEQSRAWDDRASHITR